LEQLVNGHEIWCMQEDVDRYRRSAAECAVVEGDRKRSVNASMVRRGWALVYAHYSIVYAWNEMLAKRDRAGVWNSDFEVPWEWRAKHQRR
jgi:endonuclease YncB( thermonuclease family)